MTRLPLLLLVLVGLALALVPTSGRATESRGESPHARKDACTACHLPGDAATIGAPKPIVDTCTSCHPDADMHPVGIKPRDVKVDGRWPLENGLVTCATCHAEPACDRTREDRAPFLRGGIPDRKMEFCYRCHQSTKLERTDPHHPTAAAEGAKDPTCAACHRAVPKDGAAPAASRLRVPAEESCETCHPGPVHTGVAEHVGQVQEEAPGDGLPLTKDGKIACWTCHEVHGRGAKAPAVAPRTSRIVAAMGVRPAKAPDPEHPSLLALDAEDGSLCRACHGEGP
ncbi:MAG: hypothetical protein ACOZNI_29310 [Myxococcota bacterium]